MPKGIRNLFTIIRNDNFASGELSSREVHLLVLLLMHCNPQRDGGEFICWPSNAMLAKAMNLSESQVWRVAKGLEAKGFISRKVEPAPGGRKRRFMLNRSRVSCEQRATSRPRDAESATSRPRDMQPRAHANNHLAPTRIEAHRAKHIQEAEIAYLSAPAGTPSAGSFVPFEPTQKQRPEDMDPEDRRIRADEIAAMLRAARARM